MSDEDLVEAECAVPEYPDGDDPHSGALDELGPDDEAHL